MDFQKNLEKSFEDKKLASSSIRIYIRNLEKLNNGTLKNFNFLKNSNEILEKLEKYKPNTKRGYLISIVSALSTDKVKYKKLYDEYYKLMMEKNKELKEMESKGEKTESQVNNWISWEEVTSKMKQLEQKVSDFSKLSKLNPNQYETLLSEVVLALYYYKAPRRNEYQNMWIVKNSANLPNDKNYLDFDKKSFIFNVFKTSRKEGQVVEEIPDELFSIILHYFKHHPLLGKKVTIRTNVPFLVYQNGEPLSQVNAITRILNKIFGKKVGSSLLRHVYLTEKYGDVKKEMQDDAKAMSHSVQTQQTTYVK